MSTSLPASSSVTAATVRVDCGAPLGPLRRIWTSFGYDEINWTSTPDRQAPPPDHPRASPSSRTTCARTTSSTAASAGRCRTGEAATSTTRTPPGGRSTTSASPTRCMTRWCRPGTARWWSWRSRPRALVPEDAEKRFAFEPSPTQWSPYEAGLWAMPPKDYDKWGGLVRALVAHCVERYGAESVRGWLWELWNEPDIAYWRGHGRAIPRALRRHGGGGEGGAARRRGGRSRHHRRSRPGPSRPRVPARLSRALRAARDAARLRLVPHQGRALHALAGLRTARRTGAHARSRPPASRCCARFAPRSTP